MSARVHPQGSVDSRRRRLVALLPVAELQVIHATLPIQARYGGAYHLQAALCEQWTDAVRDAVLAAVRRGVL